jgi:hypothetical protein
MTENLLGKGNTDRENARQPVRRTGRRINASGNERGDGRSDETVSSWAARCRFARQPPTAILNERRSIITSEFQ